MATAKTTQLQTAVQSAAGAPVDAKRLTEASAFYESDALKAIQSRALTYLRSGIPVHFRGPAGTGKTSLAMQIAARLGRPTVIVTGDSMLHSGNLVGEDTGMRTRQVVDRYVHSVKRIETETEAVWTDNVLTKAVLEGYTLVYDEFTRSPPAANNPLLSAFEERVLVLGSGSRSDRYVSAHPEFRAILTSNPRDYAGVNIPQDALIDRMVTFDFEEHARETEVGIVSTSTGCGSAIAEPVVDLVRALRGSANAEQPITMRSALMIAKIVKSQSFTPTFADPRFVQLCFDILKSKAPGSATDRARRAQFMDEISAAIKAHCSSELAPVVAKDDPSAARLAQAG